MSVPRAYALRLHSVVSEDTNWTEGLWDTHSAVNNGAKCFGDWLLTLRGGLDHRLADEGPVQQRKDRRILLALSWLTVEDKAGAPSELIVTEPLPVLREILVGRGLSGSDLDGWVADCAPSLQASIRPDAVWVNRSAAFDAVRTQCPTLTRDEIWDFLEPFFASPKVYLMPERAAEDGETAPKEDEAKDLVQKAGGWLSKRMGTGTGADFARMAKACDRISVWAEGGHRPLSGDDVIRALTTELADFEPPPTDLRGIVKLISGPGYKGATRSHVLKIGRQPTVSDDDLAKLRTWAAGDAVKCAGKVGGKGARPYADLIIQNVERACGFTYRNPSGAARHREFSVMLDHAARRVNVAHSWIKNAEAKRRQFEEDAKRLANVSPEALAWLDAYCKDRTTTSGASDAYRIRKRAIEGWDKVIARWSRADCQTVADRIRAARELQDDPEIEKFGDIQLFEALAEDDAVCVWQAAGKPTPELLKDYVFAKDAMAKRVRFKVPAYRHPDPLRHPVFTDFGNSRWDIDFSAHRAPSKLADLEDRVKKLRESLAEAEQKLLKAADSRREKLTAKVTELRGDLEKSERDQAEMADRHRVVLRLRNGHGVEGVPLRWSSKRLVRDLALRSPSGNGAVSVARADRLGRAAIGADAHSSVSIAGLFDEGDWNGRLQAPRKQLDAIARRVEKHGWDAKALTMRQRVHWLLSFSAKLSPQGPWTEYCKQFSEDAPARPFVSAKGEAAVKHESNGQRKGHAKLHLSRLPGLRVLSVDLGHRFAAACAVWEAITTEQMIAACKAAGVAAPDPDAMYVHLACENGRGKKTTTIYRRIGSDILPDGTSHPAPWARLDRQFLIKLQGEDRSPRKASPDEIEAVEEFEKWSGRECSKDEPPRELAVDALMSDAVRSARLALARHARRARIAFNLTADVRVRPGGIREPLSDETRLELLRDTLAEWHALAADGRWNDPHARTLWNDFLSKIPGGFAIERESRRLDDEPPTRAQRKKSEAELTARLAPLARSLAADRALAARLHDDWERRWKEDDEKWCHKLKWLSRWLMPRGRRKCDAGHRNVGGLSLSRLSTLVDFRRKVQVGYFTRMKPDGTRAETGRHFGQKTLDRIERLKDNRVKQLVSRIVEAALGAGTERARRWKDKHGKVRDRKRNDRLYWIDADGVEHGDRRFARCHAVVIEDLEHYRPEETRSRRENRQTMDWKSAETRKRLADHCQLHGLHLRDVNPQYTSRQCSRTGAPGVRCVEVEVGTFLRSPLWRKQVAQAQRKRDDGGGNARDLLLLDMHERFKNVTGDDLKQRICIPFKGGDLFFSVAGGRRGPIQADLNAAANIGLRALMDPDCPARWWYIPCDPKTRKPKGEKVKGSILDAVGSLGDPPAEPESGRARGRTNARGKQRDVVNLWRDPTMLAIAGKTWQETPRYWNGVQHRVVAILRSLLEKNPSDAELPF